jgi:hypothetical protein
MVREFRAGDGTWWRAWAVTLGRVEAVRDAGRSFGAYRDGWLAFECFDGGARKRLLRYPTDWFQLEEPALCALLDSATDVRRQGG